MYEEYYTCAQNQKYPILLNLKTADIKKINYYIYNNKVFVIHI